MRNAIELLRAAVKKCVSRVLKALRPQKPSESPPKLPRKAAKMPLVKSASKKAFRENVRTEARAGKPIKQAVAIAYATQRKAAGKPAAKAKKR